MISPGTQKGFIWTFHLCLFWGMSIFSGNDTRGVQHYGFTHSRAYATQNRSLVIKNFAEDDQGIYWCESCNKHICRDEQSIVSREIINEIRIPICISEGSSFTHSCLQASLNAKWTFEAGNTTLPRKPVKSGKNIHIANVTVEDAGKYTCWASYCGEPNQKWLSINLCVITVHPKMDDPIYCAVTDNVENYNEKHTSSPVMGRTVSAVSGHPSRYITCNASQMLDGHTTVTRSYVSSTEHCETTDVSTKSAIYKVLISLACCILMAFLIFCLISRLRSAFPFNLSCCDVKDKGDEETQVVYASVVIRMPDKRKQERKKERNSPMDDSYCIYSEIKVNNQ
ncbi:uncharacterized protein ACNS7B_018503 isoform 2-T2 [Menidia menidia]